MGKVVGRNANVGEAAAGQEVRGLQAVVMLHCRATLSAGCCGPPGRLAGRAAAGCSHTRLQHDEDGSKQSGSRRRKGLSRHRPAAGSTCGSPCLTTGAGKKTGAGRKTGAGKKTGAGQKESASRPHAHPGGRPRPRAAGSCVPATRQIKRARGKVRAEEAHLAGAAQCTRAWGRNPTTPAVARHPHIPPLTVQQSNRVRSVVTAKRPTLAQPMAHTAARGGGGGGVGSVGEFGCAGAHRSCPSSWHDLLWVVIHKSPTTRHGNAQGPIQRQRDSHVR